MKGVVAIVMGFVGLLTAAAEIPVHRFSEAPHFYWTNPPSDAFAQWLSKTKTASAVFGVGDEKALNELNARVEKYSRDEQINSTPTFVVNGTKLEGEQTMAAMDAAIAAARAKK